jgi:predicted lipoprotein with Yx(FWY)xxD motif
MSKPTTVPRSASVFLIVLVSAAAIFAALSASAGARGSKVVVKEATVKGKKILTTTSGHTLYSLSVEKHGKFICTKASSCLTLWHPLKVPSGVTPTGPVKLATVKRPEGGVQVAYRGLPLYSFTEDKRAGQTEGEGIKDVGTWHAAAVR